MEKRNKRKFSPEFKAKVVIEALKEHTTIEELARKYELHPNQISQWKKEFLARAASVFGSGDKGNADQQQQEEKIEKLYQEIGKQKIEIDWLKKKLL
jgi:transposase-like protein